MSPLRGPLPMSVDGPLANSLTSGVMSANEGYSGLVVLRASLSVDDPRRTIPVVANVWFLIAIHGSCLGH